MTSRLESVSAPVGGWNERDSLANMHKADAVILDNWFPEAGRVSLRGGYTSHSTGLGSNVETLLEYRDESTAKLIAAANGNIWDATSGTASSLGSGFTNDRWQGVMMNNLLAMVNGADTPQKYNGSTIATLSTTGPTATSLIGVYVYKSRSYFWETGSGSFWYSATNTLGGTLTEFDLNLVGSKGGYLLFMQSWSRDSGDGPDDYAVFVMSTGEVLIYSGSDPGSSTDWSLVGKFMMGTPLGIRSHLRIGGDLIIGTSDGYIPLSAVISSGQFSKKAAISDKIRKAVQKDTAAYSANFGWDAVFYPDGNRAIFNVPLIENTTYQQHVFNTITGSWCRYKMIPARCWCVFNGDLYFGGDSTVFQAENGNNDNGSNIEGDALPAYNYMGARGNIKNFGLVQHVLSSEGDLPVETVMGVDFTRPTFTYSSSTFSAAGTSWDTATWDSDDWASEGDNTLIDDWIGVSGIGYNGSARLRVSTSDQEVNWYATNYRFSIGAGL